MDAYGQVVRYTRDLLQGRPDWLRTLTISRDPDKRKALLIVLENKIMRNRNCIRADAASAILDALKWIAEDAQL
jgi:hypothetical protein